LSVLQFTASAYPYDIFKLLLGLWSKVRIQQHCSFVHPCQLIVLVWDVNVYPSLFICFCTILANDLSSPRPFISWILHLHF